MATLPEILATLWGKKQAKSLVMEYRVAFQGKPLLLRDLAMRCDIGAAAPATAIEAIKQTARQEVFAHIARIIELKPEDFISIADGRDTE